MSTIAMPKNSDELAQLLQDAKEQGAKEAANQSLEQIQKLQSKLEVATPAKEGIKIKLKDGIFVLKTTGEIRIWDSEKKTAKVLTAEQLIKDIETCEMIVAQGSDILVKYEPKSDKK